MRATWLLGSAGSLFMVGGAFATSFTLSPVVDSSSAIEGGLNLQYVHQLVTGNGGVVAMLADASDESFILKSIGGITTMIAAPDDGGYSVFREVAISTNSNTVTFEATNPSGNFALLQRSLTAGPIVRVDAAGTNIGGEEFSQNHYQVNADGVVVYKYLNGSKQAFSTAIGDLPINTFTEREPGDPDPNPKLVQFNPGAGEVPYRRQVVTQNGSVVFYAETQGANVPGIYRMDPAGVVNAVPVGVPVAANTAVLGASNNAVLFQTVTDGPTDTVHLNLNVTAGLSSETIELTTYLAPAVPQARYVAMTQQNRVAFFDPGAGVGSGAVKYYDASHNLSVVPIVAEGFDQIIDDGKSYTLKRLSADDLGQRTAPMLNDNGIVIFDAIITPNESPATDVQAYLAWDTTTQQVKVVVKADFTGVYADTFNGLPILALFPDVSVNDTTFASDVLKDALSDDNWFSFAMFQLDGDTEVISVGKTYIPEPASTGTLLCLGAAGLLRRRRFQQGV